MTRAEEIIQLFGMKPLPEEGGYYIETYRSKEKIGPEVFPGRFKGQRNLATAILYLLTVDTFSKLHRLKSDEIYHFYLGDEVTMLQLFPDGSSRVVTLGRDIADGRLLQAVVPQGVWMGCLLKAGGEFALMGTTVCPGFELEDFESADRERLLKLYPSQSELILRLT
jgi:predicted cupin superfamily sugar epimerase